MSIIRPTLAQIAKATLGPLASARLPWEPPGGAAESGAASLFATAIATPTGTAYGNTAAALTNPGVYWCIDFLFDALPPKGDSFVAGCATFSAGVGLVSAITGGNVGVTGRWVVTADSSKYTAAHPHIAIAGELNRHTRVQIWLEAAGTADATVRFFINGAEIGGGYASPGLANLGSGNKFGWNTRAGFAGTFRNDHISFVQAWTSTATTTRAQILADALAPVGSLPVAGGVSHFWLPEGASGAVATKFVDSIGGQDVVLVGTPSANGLVPQRLKRGLGTCVVMGDSRTDIPSGGTNGDVWRRPFVQKVVALGYDVAVMGDLDNGHATYDYDYRCTALGGQALRNANGMVPARLASVATDRAAGVGPDCRLILWYGPNDRAIYVLTNGQDAATCAANFATDINDEIAGWRVRNTGTIYVVYGPPQTLAGAGSAVIVASEALSYANRAADLAAWNATAGGGVKAVDAFGLLDLSNPLYSPDGTHLTDLGNTILGEFIATYVVANP